MDFDVEKARQFLRAISTLPKHDQQIRTHIYIRHKGQDCNDYTCKLPENPVRKLAIRQAMKNARR